MTCRANKALPPCSLVSPPDNPNPPTSRLCIEGQRCLHESLPSLSLNPLGQKKSGRLVASGQTQMGLSRLVVTLPFCCQDCAQGADECHGWVRRWEATQPSTRSSQHTFFAGAASVFCSVTLQMITSISGQAGRTFFSLYDWLFFSTCTRTV